MLWARWGSWLQHTLQKLALQMMSRDLERWPTSFFVTGEQEVAAAFI
jgi:hypothetical protein